MHIAVFNAPTTKKQIVAFVSILTRGQSDENAREKRVQSSSVSRLFMNFRSKGYK